jgi:hypothetical protein
MYEDKLYGVITKNYYDRKSLEWKREPEDILRKTEGHQGASRAYMDEGIKLLELTQHAVILYEKQSDQEKRQIINSCVRTQFGKMVNSGQTIEKHLIYFKKTTFNSIKKWLLFRRKTTI